MKLFSKLIITTMLIGILLVVISFSLGFNFKVIGNFFTEDEAYGEELSYTTLASITEIDFSFDDRHVDIKFIDTEETKLTYYAHEQDTWTFSDEEGVLNVTQKKSFNLFNNITFRFSSKKVKTVTVFLPLNMIDIININTNVGSIELDGADDVFDFIDIATDTGSIKAYDFETSSLRLRSKTGSVNVARIKANSVYFSSSTGNVVITDLEANDLEVRNSTGDIRLNRATSTYFDLKTSTGNIIFTNTNLNLVVIKYDLKVSTGSIRVNGNAQGNRYQTTIGDISLKAETSTGKITVTTE